MKEIIATSLVFILIAVVVIFLPKYHCVKYKSVVSIEPILIGGGIWGDDLQYIIRYDDGSLTTSLFTSSISEKECSEYNSK